MPAGENPCEVLVLEQQKNNKTSNHGVKVDKILTILAVGDTPKEADYAGMAHGCVSTYLHNFWVEVVVSVSEGVSLENV